jgi:hypothetical protein
MKENKNKHLRNIAKKIAKLEKEIRLGNNVQENRDKIENIMCSLNFGDIIFIDNYISKKKLID